LKLSAKSAANWQRLKRTFLSFRTLNNSGGQWMTSLTVHDGAMGILGNKIYLKERGKGVFLDFGKNFSKHLLHRKELLCKNI
jgi:hypothetical protein